MTNCMKVDISKVKSRWLLWGEYHVHRPHFTGHPSGLGVKGRPLFTGSLGQHSTCSFYVGKFRPQLFCANVSGLYFTGARLLGQKLCVERW